LPESDRKMLRVAEPTTRKRPKASRKAEAPRGPLAQAALRTAELARNIQQSNASTQATDALRSRVDQFGTHSAKAAVLEAALEALRESGRPVRINEELETAVSFLEGLSARLANGTFHARDALDLAPLAEGLGRVDGRLREEWAGLTSPDSHALDLASLLARFSNFQRACHQILEIEKRLAARKDKLPTRAVDVRDALKDHDRMTEVVEGLSSDGLDEEIVKFLRKVSQGYPLNDLLAAPKILEWLRRHASEFVLIPKPRSTR